MLLAPVSEQSKYSQRQDRETEGHGRVFSSAHIGRSRLEALHCQRRVHVHVSLGGTGVSSRHCVWVPGSGPPSCHFELQHPILLVTSSTDLTKLLRGSRVAVAPIAPRLPSVAPTYPVVVVLVLVHVSSFLLLTLFQLVLLPLPCFYASLVTLPTRPSACYCPAPCPSHLDALHRKLLWFCRVVSTTTRLSFV